MRTTTVTTTSSTTSTTPTTQTTLNTSTSADREFTTLQTVTSSSFKKTSLVNFRLRTNQIKEEIKKLMESKLNQNRQVKVDNKVENRTVNVNTTKLRKPNNL